MTFKTTQVEMVKEVGACVVYRYQAGADMGKAVWGVVEWKKGVAGRVEGDESEFAVHLTTLTLDTD